MSLEENYKKLGLTHNPFPLEATEQKIIDPQKDLLDDVSRFCVEVREREVDWINNKIIFLLKEGKRKECPNVWVSGKRGVGKSALLKYIVFSLQNTSIIPLYIKRPTQGLPEIYGETVRYLGVDFFLALSWSTYSEFLKQLKTEDARFIGRNEMIKQYLLEDPSRTLLFANPTDEALEKLKEKNLKPKDVDVKGLQKNLAAWLVAKERIVLPEFAQIISAFPTGPDEQFLKLRKLPGAKMIDCLVSILQIAERVKGYTAALLVIDELDQVWGPLKGPQKRKLGLDARKVYEFSRGKIKLIGTSIGAEMFNDFEKYEYIKDAIPTDPEHVLDVPEFDLDQTKRLISSYLKRARPPSTEGFIEPFNETVILALRQRHGGNARLILQECRSLLVHGASKGHSTLDERVLIEFNPSYKDLLPPIAT